MYVLKKLSGVEVEEKTPFHYNRIAVCQLQKIVKSRSIYGVLRIEIVYHIQSGITNIIRRNIEKSILLPKEQSNSRNIENRM